jgi:hypothetical protein
VTLGVFTGVSSGFADVWALSDVLTNIFNDPFIANLVPWWLGPNGVCGNLQETGEVIEPFNEKSLPNAIKTIHLGGTAYHVQNEALLPWFAGKHRQRPSTAHTAIPIRS